MISLPLDISSSQLSAQIILLFLAREAATESEVCRLVFWDKYRETIFSRESYSFLSLSFLELFM